LYNINLLACPDTYNFTKKLTLLDKLYFLGTCFLYSKTVFSMNYLNPLSRTRFSNGVAKVRFIFKSPNFFAKIFEISFLKRQSHKELPASTATRFSFGTAKVRFFPLPPNLFSARKGTEGQIMTALEEQPAHTQCRTPVVTILLNSRNCI